MENNRIVGDIMATKTVYGDVLDSDANAILHQVNCRGVMGSGLARQVKDRYPHVFEGYAKLCKDCDYNPEKLLGTSYAVRLNERLLFSGEDIRQSRFIVNLFAQDGYGYGKCFTDYEALRLCLYKVDIAFRGMRVAIPYKMSCCRGGGNWDVVYRIIEEELKDCEVEIYKLKRESS